MNTLRNPEWRDAQRTCRRCFDEPTLAYVGPEGRASPMLHEEGNPGSWTRTPGRGRGGRGRWGVYLARTPMMLGRLQSRPLLSS